MDRVFFWLAVLFTSSKEIHCETQILSVDSYQCATYKIRQVEDGQDYKITWKGGPVPYYCKFGFNCGDNDKICVEATEFEFNDCNLQLKYQKGFGSVTYKTFSCGDIATGKFCGEFNDFVDVEFDLKNVGEELKSNPGKATLKVTVESRTDYGVIIGSVIGGIIAGIFLISVVVCIVLNFLRKNRTPGTVLRSPAPVPSAPVTQTNVYPTQQTVPNTVMHTTTGVPSTYNADPPPPYHQVVTTCVVPK